MRITTAAENVAQRVIKTISSKMSPKAETKTISSKVALKAERARQKAVKVAQATENVAQKTEKKLSVARHIADEAKPAHSARNFHPGKHEAARPAHAPHEKRKVA